MGNYPLCSGSKPCRTTLGAYWDDVGGRNNKLPFEMITSREENITDGILDRFMAHPMIRSINLYGPTGVTIGCTNRTMSFADVKENICHPFPSARPFVVDKDTNVVPKGVAGELMTKG